MVLNPCLLVSYLPTRERMEDPKAHQRDREAPKGSDSGQTGMQEESRCYAVFETCLESAKAVAGTGPLTGSHTMSEGAVVVD